MKGVSAVIATILMLMITIALAGMAYMYISGVFTARTAVVLAITDSECTTSDITVWVRNDGTVASGTITVDVDGYSCTINSLTAGTESSCTTTGRPSGAGYYTVRVSTTGASARGTVYCAS